MQDSKETHTLNLKMSPADAVKFTITSSQPEPPRTAELNKHPQCWLHTLPWDGDSLGQPMEEITRSLPFLYRKTDKKVQNRKRDTEVWNRLLDSVGEGEGGMFQENSIETCILSRVKWITGPGWMHETSARAWCTGKTQRDRVEREVGGGIGRGNTCKSMAHSCQCMTEPTTML